MVYNSHGVLTSVLLCEPTYYEIVAFSEVAKQHIEEGMKVSREAAVSQHAELVDVFRQLNVEMKWQDAEPGHPDQVATRDFGVNTNKGVLVGNFRYEENEGDVELAMEALNKYDVPIIGKVSEGALEGGDCWYLDEETMAIGIGNRTELEGLEEARKILTPYNIEVVNVQFEEKWNHLDMIFSVLAEKTVMLCEEALPDSFLSLLKKRNYEFISVPGDSVFDGTINVLALGESKVLSFKENKLGNEKLKALGFEVYDPALSQFVMSGTGPHCLTFELSRGKN